MLASNTPLIARDFAIMDDLHLVCDHMHIATLGDCRPAFTRDASLQAQHLHR